jgi:hypothetical protein
VTVCGTEGWTIHHNTPGCCKCSTFMQYRYKGVCAHWLGPKLALAVLWAICLFKYTGHLSYLVYLSLLCLVQVSPDCPSYFGGPLTCRCDSCSRGSTRGHSTTGRSRRPGSTLKGQQWRQQQQQQCITSYRSGSSVRCFECLVCDWTWATCQCLAVQMGWQGIRVGRWQLCMYEFWT